jgi:probable rRNA maturation factor
MRLSLEINNQSQQPVRKILLTKIFQQVFRTLDLELGKEKKIDLSLALVMPQEMKRINRIWRQQNAVTDVLSFSEFKSFPAIKKAQGKELFLGEIILCYDKIKVSALKKRWEISGELAWVFSHGILHLLGFRHGEKMFSLQTQILKSLRNKK